MEISRRDALFGASATAAGLAAFAPAIPAAAAVTETIPPAPGTPAFRAARALAQEYLEAHEGNGRRAMQFLLADLMHYADKYKLGFEETLKAAGRNYRIEKEIEGRRAIENNETESTASIWSPMTEADFALRKEGIEARMILVSFMSQTQLAMCSEMSHRDDRKAIAKKLIRWAKLVSDMPQSRDQEGKYEDAIACLHYFTDKEHWYIIEKDKDCSQKFAFGVHDIGDGMPWRGRVDISRLIYSGVDFDFDFFPQPLSKILPEYSRVLGRSSPRPSWSPLRELQAHRRRYGWMRTRTET